jgi:CO dehydrogenase/acetyl-CoA synthase gamma subunit (corrinoid Fe-S protein)
VTVGEETVFFRHDKTFVRRPPLLRVLDPSEASKLEAWRAPRIERAGEVFQVDGVAIPEAPGAPAAAVEAARAGVAKALRELRATERVSHHTVIIPGYVAVISGELEDALGEGWRVLVGPQEASDLAPFFRDVWAAARAG